MSAMTKIGVGSYSIMLNDEILKRFEWLSECGYMVEELQKVIDKIIEIYDGEFDGGKEISAEDCMQMISILKDAKRDYRFLSTLSIEGNSVLGNNETTQ